ncbi:SDR family oxidoreductase [Shewanella psychropiezotolerans]|uniref:SDR family oxidoreductase n=2 Tax=Shewanella psychropiezotolerans TaxID=2593655 RepID=A0ABX5X6R9_9GAMM|nr:SDR family NAD(P)-dependent oxidoreductase [Shewanella sp. YLB-07]MPY24948.1 SDR family oxidoreductase [Shewanella sp. YLB-07]QDO86628.1 SDR family oxidoreductase [Shewanella psychropiezotolerans]
MNEMLAGKSVLVTGASRGIGRAIALTFAEQGATVYLNGRDQACLSDLKTELRALYGDRIHTLVFDVSDAAQVKQGFQALFKLTKTLDVLVNNAGILEHALVGMVSDEQIQKSFASNTFSVIYTSQYASRLMTRNGGGSIINMASIIGCVGSSGDSVYSGSKAAVIGITKSLAKELAAAQIRVNAIAPGFIDTQMNHSLSVEKQDQILQSIAMGRKGSPQDVANTALFLASDLAQYVTGQVIGVDGGMLI